MTPQITLRAQAIRHAPAVRTAVLTSAVVSVCYYLTAVIGFGFALQPGSVSALWMPNSILLAGLLLTPRRWWWLVILTVLPAHLASELSSGVPTAMVLSWFVSNVAQALFAAFCICKLVEDGLRFDRFRDLTMFIVFCAFLAPFLSSFLDAALVKLNGWGNNSYWDIWRVRFFSNLIATLTLVPVVMLWVSGGIAALRKASPLRYLEGSLLFLGLLGVGIFVFDIQQDLADKTSSLLYLPLPFLLWATVRFGPRGTSTSLLLVMFLAILGATRGAGPFVTSSSAHNALSVQLFLIVTSIPLMALAAVIEERQRAEALARRNEERLTLALNAAQMVTWDWQIPENTLVWTEDTKHIFGVTDADSIDSFFRVVHPDELEQLGKKIEKPLELRKTVQLLQDQANELSAEIHRLSYKLHPAKLDHLGLVAAVKSLCTEITQSGKLKVDFRHTGFPGELNKDVTLCVFRIAQEGLRNCVKHSGADSVEVMLTKTRSAVRLLVSDNGCGFNTKSGLMEKGLGFINMKERLHPLGGEMTVYSQPQGGTRIKVSVPLRYTKLINDLDVKEGSHETPPCRTRR